MSVCNFHFDIDYDDFSGDELTSGRRVRWRARHPFVFFTARLDNVRPPISR